MNAPGCQLRLGLLRVGPIVRPAAFTVIELMLGLVITSLVTGALAAFTFAMSTSWKNTETTQSLFISGNQAVLRIQNTLRSAKQPGLVRAGTLNGSGTGAAVMLWLNDASTYGGAANDVTVQFSEIGLIQHDPTQKTITLYHVVFPSSLSAAQKTAANTAVAYHMSDLNSSTAPEDFKALRYVTGTILARNVVGAQFFVSSAGSATIRPSLEFILNLNRNGRSQTVYGSATLRDPNQGG